MTNLIIANMGQGARAAHPAIARISFLMLILLTINAFGAFGALASARIPSRVTIVRHLETYANGGSLNVQMDENYALEFGSCSIDANLVSGGAYLEVGIENSCIPRDGEWTIAVITVRFATGSINSVWELSALDGVVELNEIDL